MEAILFIGIQGAGKTTFYRECLFETHVRISLDQLRTRRRERLLVEACLEAKQRFVVDNTNVTAEERAKYIVAAKRAGFRVVGFFFEPDPRASARRNQARQRQVPPAAIYGTLKRLERPTRAEGFDEICCVEVTAPGGFAVHDYPG